MATVLSRTGTRNGWDVQLDNGKSYHRDDLERAMGISGWLHLKEMCEKQNTFITHLGLRVGEAYVTVENPQLALGFWQAAKMWAGDRPSQYTEDIDWHWYGIGSAKIPDTIECLWVAMPHTPYARELPDTRKMRDSSGKVVALYSVEMRLAATEKRIIWRPGVKPTPSD